MSFSHAVMKSLNKGMVPDKIGMLSPDMIC